MRAKFELRSKGATKMTDSVTQEENDQGTRTALGTLLIEAGFVDNERLDEALRIGEDTGERLGEVVVRMGWASEDDLAKILAKQWRLRYVERSAISFDENALSRMSREEATRLEALPMQVSKDGTVVVAVAEPTDERLGELKTLLGDRIDCVVVAKAAIDAGLRSKLLAPAAEAVVETTDDPGRDDGGQDDFGKSSNGFGGSNGLNAVSPVANDNAGTSERTASDFDDVAKTLRDSLSSQLDSLRGIVVEAEANRERDKAEIARLTSELAERKTELSDLKAELFETNNTIRSTQQTLRELASTLEHKS